MESQTEAVNQQSGRSVGLVEDRQNAASPSLSSSLPEDDGMESLRQKMREIHNLAVSTEEKARAMHLLMTRDYRASNTNNSQPTLLEQSGVESEDTVMQVPTADNPYNIYPAALEISHCPEPVPLCDEEDMPGGVTRRALGCQHYTRNVKVQCYDCNLWFPCRHCHDSDKHLPFPHQLNRKKTQNMLCMICKTAQPAGDECVNCGTETAYYYCNKCKLWDNDSTKRIYHCDDCGICRRGEGLGKDYVHCKRCDVCISISTSSTHPCIERATDCDCPLCLDYLFSSSQPVVSLLCGHYMHAGCYKDLMTVTYRCPVCNKSAVNMELQWRKLDDEIRLQPMPEEDFEPLSAPSSRPSSEVLDMPSINLQHGAGPEQALSPTPPVGRVVPRKVWIGCNDCGGKGWTAFHWLGLRCTICDGYNTTQMTPLGNASTTRTMSRAYQVQHQHDFTGLGAIRSFGDGSGEGAGAGLGVDGIRALAEETRTDSAYGCSTSPSNQAETEWTSQSPPGRSYFLRAEQEESGSGPSALLRPDRVLTAGEMIRGLPYEMVMRLGRSLSPMRYYIDGLDLRSDGESQARVDAEAVTAATTAGEKPGSGERTPRQGRSFGSEEESESSWRPEWNFLAGWQSNSEEEDDGGHAIGADDEEEEEEEEDDDDDDESDYEDEEDLLDAEGEDEEAEEEDGELVLPGHP